MKIFKHKESGNLYILKFYTQGVEDSMSQWATFNKKQGLYAMPYEWTGPNLAYYNITDINTCQKFIQDNFIHIGEIL